MLRNEDKVATSSLQVCQRRRISNVRTTTSIFAVVAAIFVAVLSASAQVSTNFESFSVGTVHNQFGWSSLGAAGSGCAVYDHAIVNGTGLVPAAPSAFGSRSLRISNAVTSGCFSDQTFTSSNPNEAGEASATNGGLSGGTRTSHYETQFSIASVLPTQQSGLFMSVSPDRGDGARMSYVGFDDQADGIHVLFYDYRDLAPFGGANGDDANGCNAGGDDFVLTDVATINRTSAHLIKIVIDFVAGPRNDVVKVYIDGVLVKTGTTWEDYYRFCAEQIADNNTHTVDSLLFRTGGTAAPATAGKGYLIDGTSSVSLVPSTSVVSQSNLNNWLFYNDETDTVDNALGSFAFGPGTPPFGSGSARIQVTGTQRRNLASYQFSGIALSSINTLAFSTYNPSAGNGGSSTRSGYLHFNVDFNLSDTWQRRLVYLPSQNGTVLQNTWQEWDALNGGNALWSLSGGTWPVGIGGGGESNTTLKSWSQILSQYPNVRIRVTDAFLGIRVGEPYNDGYTEYIDGFKFGTTSSLNYYNFEAVPASIVVDDDGQASALSCDDPDPAQTTIAAAYAAASPGDTIRVCPGTYPQSSTLNLNKANTTILGVGASKPIVQVASAIGNGVMVSASGVTLNNLEIQKTDLANQTVVHVAGDNFTATNNLIYGPNPGATWSVAGFVSRAFVVQNLTNTTITNNVIHTLRQPAYISGDNGVSEGTISGNNVSGTKGWVIEGGKFTFTGNTWGEPQNQDCDIALLASVSAADYTPLLALSNGNDNAYICAQYGGGENGRATAYVDDGAGSGGNGSDNTKYNSINAGVAGALTGGTVQVAGGAYNEDVTVGKSVKVLGAGSTSTTVSGPIGGSGSTFAIAASNVELSGFTITRDGNTVVLWNDPNLNTAGLSIQGQAISGALVHDNNFVGNRSAIDINNSNGHTFRNNVLDNNRTGVIFRNQTDTITFVENQVTNNWTVGVLFLDGSGGTNSPVQTAANCTFFNNSIAGNWYGEIVDRQSGGSLPAPGTNLKNFSGNWYGNNAPVVTTANSAEPGYAAQIPVFYGGAATDPGGQPDIAGPASANFDFSPFLNVGTDTNAETTSGRGTYGFQGSFNALNVSAASAQTGGTSKIQEAVNLITPGGSLFIPVGTYAGNVNVNKALTIQGTFTVGGSFTTSAAGVVVNPGTSPGIITSGNLAFGTGTNVNVELNGVLPGTNYDRFDVTGTVNIASGANLNVLVGYVPGAGHSYTIINNDGVDPVVGEFSGRPDGGVFFVGPYSFTIDYQGGDGNDVVITAVSNCNAVSIPTNITSLTGTTVNVPVNVDNTTGNGLLSTDFTLTYNTSVLSNPVVSVGTVTAGRTLTVNNSTPGVIIVSVFGTTPFTGAGTVANVSFTVNGLPGSSSPVSFSAFKFNEGTPCSSTSNGLVTVLSGTISGTVTYGNVVGVPVGPRFIPSVTLNAVGSVNVSTTTAPSPTSNGQYTLSGMGAGAYTVTPSKVGGVLPLLGGGNTITSQDAGLVAQYVALLVPLTPAQQAAADVSGTGGITSFDAALIARWVVSLPGSGNTASWVFTPASRPYANVNSNVSGEDYSAILMGDVTGNYSQTLTPARPVSPDDENAVVTTAPTLTAHAGTVVSVPLTVGDTTGSGITSYQFLFRYDPTVLEPATEPVDLSGTISRGYIPTVNSTEPGVLQVVVFGTMPLTGEGALLNLRFNTIGAVDSTSRLEWGNFSFNEGSVIAQTVDGSLRVTAATDGVINGRVLSPMGAGIRNTRVTAIDTHGNAVSVITSSFGNFQIAGLQQGETYIVKVDSKRYRFGAQTVSLSGSAVSLDLIAQE